MTTIASAALERCCWSEGAVCLPRACIHVGQTSTLSFKGVTSIEPAVPFPGVGVKRGLVVHHNDNAAIPEGGKGDWIYAWMKMHMLRLQTKREVEA